MPAPQPEALPFRQLLPSGVGIVFVAVGAAQFGGIWPTEGLFESWGYPAELRMVVGGFQMCGGMLLLVPRLMVFGAVMLLSAMVGAVGTHLSQGQPGLAIVPVLFGLVLVRLILGAGAAGPEVPSDGLASEGH